MPESNALSSKLAHVTQTAFLALRLYCAYYSIAPLLLPYMAPKVGLEPTTNRLTADCSTTELLGINVPSLLLLGSLFAP
jgi:hypothetical protein